MCMLITNHKIGNYLSFYYSFVVSFWSNVEGIEALLIILVMSLMTVLVSSRIYHNRI